MTVEVIAGFSLGFAMLARFGSRDAATDFGIEKLLVVPLGLVVMFVIHAMWSWATAPRRIHKDQIAWATELISELDATKNPDRKRLERFKDKRRDVAEQAKYLTSSQDAVNVSVTVGQVIIDEVSEGLLDGRSYGHKMHTRVNAIMTESYDLQRTGVHGHMSKPRAAFIVYMSVRNQEPNSEVVLNPELLQSVQRIDAGIRQLVEDFDHAIARLETRLSH